MFRGVGDYPKMEKGRNIWERYDCHELNSLYIYKIQHIQHARTLPNSFAQVWHFTVTNIYNIYNIYNLRAPCQIPLHRSDTSQSPLQTEFLYWSSPLLNPGQVIVGRFAMWFWSFNSNCWASGRFHGQKHCKIIVVVKKWLKTLNDQNIWKWLGPH